MSIGAWMILAGVELYLLIYAYKIIRILKHFYNAIGYEKGKVISEYAVENVKVGRGNAMKTSIPIYQFVMNGQDVSFKGYVRHKELEIGEEVNIVYDERRGMFWCEREIPMLKQNLIIRITILQILLLLMVMVEIVFL